MKYDKITIDRNTVKELNRTQFENVLFAVYNDNVAFKKRIVELEAMVAELNEFKKLANVEKYTPSSEEMGLDLRGKAMFIFLNKAKNTLKILVWDDGY